MKDQLCWSCDRIDCSWRSCLQPVDGWNATPSVTCDGIHSYCITECPLFHKWERNMRTKEKIRWEELRDDIIMKLPRRERILLQAKKAGCKERDLRYAFGGSVKNPKTIIDSALDKYYEILIREEII